MKSVGDDPLLETLRSVGRTRLRTPDPQRFSPLVAARAAENRTRNRRRRVFAGGSGVVLAAIVLLSAFLRAPLDEASVESRAAVITLRGGDRMLQPASEAVDVRIEVMDTERRLVVGRGEALFDVQPLVAGERFVVATPHFDVEVVGTIFSVRVENDRSMVRVFEGVVRVTTVDGQSRTITAGDDFGVGSGWRGLPSKLAGEGRRLAEGRAVQSLRADIGDEREVPQEVQHVPALAPNAASTGSGPRDTARPAPLERASPTLSLVRGWVLEGRLADARREAARRSHEGPEWEMLLGDVCRSLADHECAAEAYEGAAARMRPSRATQAGYLAAELRVRHLHDAAGALRSLQRSGSADPESPVEERALVLRVEILTELGRSSEARISARRYLLAYPGGPAVERMRAVARADGARE